VNEALIAETKNKLAHYDRIHLLRTQQERVIAESEQLYLQNVLKALASQPEDWQPILESLAAFAAEEKESARIRKDREMYQFYAGYLAAIERVQSKTAPPPPAGEPGGQT